MATKGIAEALKQVAEVEDEEQRADDLRWARNNIPGVYHCLKHAYKDALKWDLPKGKPPFKRAVKEMDAQGVLQSRIRTFEYFVTGNHPNVNKARREKMFIDLLEIVDPDDADLLVMVKDKKLKYNRRLTKAFVKKALGAETESW